MKANWADITLHFAWPLHKGSPSTKTLVHLAAYTLAERSHLKHLRISCRPLQQIHMYFAATATRKISAQPHPTLCIQFLERENNDKSNTLPLGKQICFTIVWGCAEILPSCHSSKTFKPT